MTATLIPRNATDGYTLPFNLNYPPASELLREEFSITPQYNFSLNDLINHDLIMLNGTVFNGSFDTPYARIPIGYADLVIGEFVTIHYLNSSAAIPNYTGLRYYTYPRTVSSNPLTPGWQHFYMAHHIHSVPDFDQVVHSTIDTTLCQVKQVQHHLTSSIRTAKRLSDSATLQKLYHQHVAAAAGGATSKQDDAPLSVEQILKVAGLDWEIDTIPNSMNRRLMPVSTPSVSMWTFFDTNDDSTSLPTPPPSGGAHRHRMMRNSNNNSKVVNESLPVYVVSCIANILEENHCVSGPMFGDICPPLQP
jgi:hypothetical protein